MGGEISMNSCLRPFDLISGISVLIVPDYREIFAMFCPQRKSIPKSERKPYTYLWVVDSLAKAFGRVDRAGEKSCQTTWL